MRLLAVEETIEQETCGQVNVVCGRNHTCLVFAVRTFSSNCRLVLGTSFISFSRSVCLEHDPARLAKNCSQNDDAGTRDVCNTCVAVTLSSNKQRNSGTHIISQMTARHADGARKLAPMPPGGATRTRTRADALTHMVNERNSEDSS